MLHLFNKKITAQLFLLVIICCNINAQNVDLGNLKSTFNKSNAIKITGGINANTIYYDGNTETGRDPFNWYLQGNVNVSLFGQINLPFSLNLTNAGSHFQTPNSPNRIGVHPSYKWITAHIGDVAMNFSPYTLNGHQFTGVGVDLAPKGRFRMSAMYGRLQNAVEYDSLNKNSLPAYKRIGYGTKILYTNQGLSFGATVFSASDKLNSLNYKPDTVQVYPQQNLVTSFNIGLRPSKGVEFTAEYAMSALTKDIRDTSPVNSKSSNLLSNIISARNSTGYYKAIKAQLNFNVKTTTIGFGYERIDPGYRTLGAYFFANDLENITINFSKTLFKNKATLAGNFGVQKDDLDDAKSGKNTRYVTAANFNYNPNDKIATTLSYSNFQTYMNIKPIFQLINQVNQFQNLDTLNYTQISQNANLNVNYIIKSSTSQTQNLNCNISYQSAVDKQNIAKQDAGNSQFYNGSFAYNIFLAPSGTNILAAFNINYNTTIVSNATTLGPTVGISTKWLKKKISTGIVASYNKTTSNISTENKSSVLNLRFNAAYAFIKKHNLFLSIINQTREVVDKPNATSVVGNIGYSFSF